MAIIQVPASKLPNVFQRMDDTDTCSHDIAVLRTLVYPMLLEFIDVVAPKYPHYTFVLEIGSAVHVARMVKVFQGAEEIGSVGTHSGHSSRIVRYGLITPAIRQERRRGDRNIQTTVLKTAVKTFNRYFQPKTTLQVLEERVQEVQRVMRMAGNLRTTFRNGFEGACFIAKDLIMEQWDTIAAIAVGQKYSAANLEMVRDKYHESSVADALENAHSRREGHYVVITDSTYQVADIELSGVQTFASETLPIHIRTKVGMLKLVPDQTFVPNVGVRSSAKVFYILPEVA